MKGLVNYAKKMLAGYRIARNELRMERENFTPPLRRKERYYSEDTYLDRVPADFTGLNIEEGTEEDYRRFDVLLIKMIDENSSPYDRYPSFKRSYSRNGKWYFTPQVWFNDSPLMSVNALYERVASKAERIVVYFVTPHPAETIAPHIHRLVRSVYYEDGAQFRAVLINPAKLESKIELYPWLFICETPMYTHLTELQ